MHLNKVVLIGRVGERGVKLSYSESAIPTCTFTLEVDEAGKTGKVFTSYLPVEVVGKYAEDAGVQLEPGDEVLIDDAVKYRCTTDPKTHQKTRKLLISCWTVTKATPASADSVS